MVRQARGVKLVMLRRYAAKIAYELDLHGAEPDPERMPARYAELLASTTRVAWPRESWPREPDGSLAMITAPLDLHALLREPAAR